VSIDSFNRELHVKILINILTEMQKRDLAYDAQMKEVMKNSFEHFGHKKINSLIRRTA
jgi:hypothetical protein